MPGSWKGFQTLDIYSLVISEILGLQNSEHKRLCTNTEA